MYGGSDCRLAARAAAALLSLGAQSLGHQDSVWQVQELELPGAEQLWGWLVLRNLMGSAK